MMGLVMLVESDNRGGTEGNGKGGNITRWYS